MSGRHEVVHKVPLPQTFVIVRALSVVLGLSDTGADSSEVMAKRKNTEGRTRFVPIEAAL